MSRKNIKGKKGDINPVAFILGMLLLVFFLVITFIVIMFVTEECNEEIFILKGVNGVTDQDSGIISSGDTSTTTLLMEGGVVITLNRRVSKLKIGERITLNYCKSWVTEGSYKLK